MSCDTWKPIKCPEIKAFMPNCWDCQHSVYEGFYLVGCREEAKIKGKCLESVPPHERKPFLIPFHLAARCGHFSPIMLKVLCPVCDEAPIIRARHAHPFWLTTPQGDKVPVCCWSCYDIGSKAGVGKIGSLIFLPDSQEQRPEPA